MFKGGRNITSLTLLQNTLHLPKKHIGMQKPGIPKGTRDFSPAEIAGRHYIFNHISKVYELHGYKPIETPAMESLNTLLGKYGDEGDRLIFRILNSGDFASKANKDDWANRDSAALSSQISEKALRYDLTVPFARFVVQYQNGLTFPFKRYQIQPVWRADRPQKGRYREFFQCDADVIGSNSLANEAELLQIIDQVFERLGIRVVIKINNRKILAGIAEAIGHADKLIPITVAIDKLDKIGLEAVTKELLENGIGEEGFNALQPVLLFKGTDMEKLQFLKGIFPEASLGRLGLEEIETVMDIVSKTPLKCALELDLTLARGLNYYTGAIIEVKALDTEMGSLCGGGRYDDLTGIFGLPGVSGVGISFGADRIYDVMRDLKLFPDGIGNFTKVLAINFGDKERNYCLPLLQKLRSRGISCEMYPELAKLKKQMLYADKNKIPFVILVGENELSQGLFTIKNMKTGTQTLVDEQQLIGYLTSDIN